MKLKVEEQTPRCLSIYLKQDYSIILFIPIMVLKKRNDGRESDERENDKGENDKGKSDKRESNKRESDDRDSNEGRESYEIREKINVKIEN